MNTNNNDNNINTNIKTSKQRNGDINLMFDHSSSNSSTSSPHLLVFTDCLNNPDNNNNKQSIKKEQMISGNSSSLSSPSSSHNSVIELQCIMKSKSKDSQNQSSILFHDIFNAKTAPVTPCRRIKQHQHNYTTKISDTGISNYEQKKCTNITTTTTTTDNDNNNSTSSKHKSSTMLVTNTSFKDFNSGHYQRKKNLSYCNASTERKLTTRL